MDPNVGFTTTNLTEDLVVEILSRVPFKSFCRFKCVCKAWLAFSSDPHYCKKLPKIPTGLFQKVHHNLPIQFVSLSSNDEDIDGALTFLPQYERLKLVNCCNGLVLCEYSSSYTPDICRFIVCNPATREWRMLPDTHRGPDGSRNTAILAFDPSWLTQFYVFNFQEEFFDDVVIGVSKLEVFSSDLSTWFVDDAWSSEITVSPKLHLFIGGVLHVQTDQHEILVFEGLEAVGSGIPPRHFTIKLPHDCLVHPTHGCFSQSSGSLQYAIPERDGGTVVVWSLDVYHPYEWSVKYRLNLRDAFGRDELVHNCSQGWLADWDYQIAALDLEREVLFLADYVARKLWSYNISTRKLTEVQDGYGYCWAYYCYVACYSKLPAYDMCMMV